MLYITKIYYFRSHQFLKKFSINIRNGGFSRREFYHTFATKKIPSKFIENSRCIIFRKVSTVDLRVALRVAGIGLGWVHTNKAQLDLLSHDFRGFGRILDRIHHTGQTLSNID